MSSDCYRRVTAPVQAVLKEKRSEFIATVVPAQGMEQAKKAIESISKDHLEASHNCWAYRVGFPRTDSHCSDDGEPSGSAGRPILGAVLSRDLYDLALVVTRYFGGVKLGVRGLMEAYGAAAAQALERAATEELLVTRPLTLVSDYQRFQDLLHQLRQAGLDAPLWKLSYMEQVTVTVWVPRSLEESLRERTESYHWRQLMTAPPQWASDFQGLPVQSLGDLKLP